MQLLHMLADHRPSILSAVMKGNGERAERPRGGVIQLVMILVEILKPL